jgi:hypothetical protein
MSLHQIIVPIAGCTARGLTIALALLVLPVVANCSSSDAPGSSTTGLGGGSSGNTGEGSGNTNGTGGSDPGGEERPVLD